LVSILAERFWFDFWCGLGDVLKANHTTGTRYKQAVQEQQERTSAQKQQQQRSEILQCWFVSGALA
jgi:hypothetical protein